MKENKAALKKKIEKQEKKVSQLEAKLRLDPNNKEISRQYWNAQDELDELSEQYND